jgi:shikimate kinase
MSRIVIVGYRGSGKSVVGSLLASRLGYGFVDADLLLQARAGITISEMFATQGEAAFRALESQILTELLTAPEWTHHVISTGGGVVISPDNRAFLKSQYVVWLTASPEVLHERITGDPATAALRPNLTPTGGLEEVRVKLAEREPWYREVATLRLNSGRQSPEMLADTILSEYRS